VDFVATGVVSTFGAGLFTGLAPAASLAGSWLLAAFVAAAGLGYLTVLSTSERPLDTVPVTLRRLVFGLGALGRLAAAVAVAGTFGQYLTPSRAQLGAAALVAVVTVVVVVAPRPPVVVVRVAAGVVLGCLTLVVLACFAIEPVAPAVATAEATSPLGVIASAGLLTVCFLGVGPLPRGARVVDVHLPPLTEPSSPPATSPSGTSPLETSQSETSPLEISPSEISPATRPDAPPTRLEAGEPASGRQGEERSPALGGRAETPLEFGVGRVAVRTWRLGVVAVFAVVLVGCLAVGAAVLRQLGAPRLALSPAPLVDALAAADAAALEPLVLGGVAIATGFVLLGILRGVAASGGAVPAVRVAVAAGAVVAVGAVVVEPTVALAAAAVLLLGDVALRLVAVRHRGLE